MQLGWRGRFDFVVPKEVETELVVQEQASVLKRALDAGWLVASDERRRFLRLARERLGPGRVLNTPGLFLMAVRAGLLAVEEADREKSRWKESASG